MEANIGLILTECETIGQGPPRCPFPLLLKRFVKRHSHGEEAGSQAVGVVLVVRDMGKQRTRPGMGVGEHKNHLPESTVF